MTFLAIWTIAGFLTVMFCRTPTTTASTVALMLMGGPIVLATIAALYLLVLAGKWTDPSEGQRPEKKQK